MGRESEHTCHATACDRRVPPAMFMCRPHWYALPQEMRDAIWDAYQPGQERLDGTAFSSEEYLRVTREAIQFLEAKQGRQQRLL
jgi:hypothetical protein